VAVAVAVAVAGADLRRASIAQSHLTPQQHNHRHPSLTVHVHVAVGVATGSRACAGVTRAGVRSVTHMQRLVIAPIYAVAAGERTDLCAASQPPRCCIL
jgi:hypothetical protein